MPRTLAALVGALAIALPASAQSPVKIPDAPPATPQLVGISPESTSPAFLDVTFGEREMRYGVMVGRFWLINVFREPTEADGNGIADSSWSLYQTECATTSAIRIVSFWVDYSGRPVATVPADPKRVLQSASGSPLEAGANLACRGVTPDGQRYTTVNEIVNVVRKD